MHSTTPESPVIQRELYEMVQNGCGYAVVESSSHGLSKKLGRLENVLFDGAVFMNVTLEHLEFHKTFEQYRDDKMNLFRALDVCSHKKTVNNVLHEVEPVGVVNLEDESAKDFVSATKAKCFGYTSFGMAGRGAAASGEPLSIPPLLNIPYLAAKEIASTDADISFELDSSDYDGGAPLYVNANLPGAFNAYNLMASFIIVHRLAGIPLEELCKSAASLVPIKGRMTHIECGQPFEVIVDYAHTPSSFEVIFPPLRKRCRGKIFALFGSGGERDLTKRPLQGEVAAKYADVIILCDEDPRGEDPRKLLEDIASGALKAGKVMNANLYILPDRPKAIRTAFSMAGKDDIVLLLGKGHENSIIYKDRVMPYDEMSEAKKALSEMGYN